jgi:hypothetical protein
MNVHRCIVPTPQDQEKKEKWKDKNEIEHTVSHQDQKKETEEMTRLPQKELDQVRVIHPYFVSVLKIKTRTSTRRKAVPPA